MAPGNSHSVSAPRELGLADCGGWADLKRPSLPHVRLVLHQAPYAGNCALVGTGPSEGENRPSRATLAERDRVFELALAHDPLSIGSLEPGCSALRTDQGPYARHALPDLPRTPVDGGARVLIPATRRGGKRGQERVIVRPRCGRALVCGTASTVGIPHEQPCANARTEDYSEDSKHDDLSCHHVASPDLLSGGTTQRTACATGLEIGPSCRLCAPVSSWESAHRESGHWGVRGTPTATYAVSVPGFVPTPDSSPPGHPVPGRSVGRSPPVRGCGAITVQFSRNGPRARCNKIRLRSRGVRPCLPLIPRPDRSGAPGVSPGGEAFAVMRIRDPASAGGSPSAASSLRRCYDEKTSTQP